MKYWEAKEIKEAQKFFANKIYVTNFEKYADEVTYKELNGLYFLEFEAGENEYGEPEVIVTVGTPDPNYEVDNGQRNMTFDDAVDAVYDRYFTIDRENQIITIK